MAGSHRPNLFRGALKSSCLRVSLDKKIPGEVRASPSAGVTALAETIVVPLRVV